MEPAEQEPEAVKDELFCSFEHERLAVTFSSAAGGLFFAKPMREKRYITMMDPFQIRYGNLLSGALVLPSILMDVLWVASTLLGLGEPRPRWPAEP